MSRIHEALQRAYLERGNRCRRRKTFALPSRRCTSSFDGPPPIKPELVLENIKHYQWRPSAASFPTLPDRGAGVEQFRSLRSHVYQAHYESPLKTIVIGKRHALGRQELCRGKSGHEPGPQ